ncbi:MAG: hypothetical protein EXX96DRAFT_543264 [Benjaminiella poitrasii]|nr:MAG: hypothetical protein EXX96DRAFT_543264 [Benjaminiella poitrasii]
MHIFFNYCSCIHIVSTQQKIFYQNHCGWEFKGPKVYIWKFSAKTQEESPQQREDDEKHLPGSRKQRARDALLEAFHEIGSITLSGLHRHLILHASLTRKKLEPIVSSRTALDVWLLSQCSESAK